MKKLAVLVFGAAALLAACGGGDDTPPATSQVSEGASASIGGFISYLQELVTAQGETLEPVDVSGVTPQTDETTLPTVVD